MRKEVFIIINTIIGAAKCLCLPVVFTLFIAVCFASSACNKIIEIDPPSNSIVNEVQFSDSLNASSAILGLYGVLNSVNSPFASGNMTAVMGAYSDEFGVTTTDDEAYPFYIGLLDPRTSGILSFFWEPIYNYIYQSNVIIEEVEKSKGISEKNKAQFIGEAKFLRAYCYSYLVNLYGEVPLILTSKYKNNMSVPKSQISAVLDIVVQDLRDAYELLPDGYDWLQGQRTRANRFSAAALLSRMYLYKSDWSNAEKFASILIDQKDIFGLADNCKNAFDPNSKEAILQFFSDPNLPPYNLTLEGVKLVPRASFIRFFLRSEFVESLLPDDLRKQSWIDSIQISGEKKYYARKYRLGAGMGTPGGVVPQFYTLLRMGEQLLIRAESRMKLKNFSGAKADLDQIRFRSGLGEIEDESASGIERALHYERMAELMFEGGHRWFDLKRWGMADSVNSQIKNNWKPYMKVFPLPALEIQRNPSLVQNDGY
ncbi:RagB/SusD family nutrient uptake outer membrane protein [Chitinophaga sp. NPDC101104]|uniref:RagB/SusD family nutrient uptake outer membrane protein n=1 Tax=Chitinophaga sp. NPDC101104 TaxID=3390561 RepID=UPI003CFC0484